MPHDPPNDNKAGFQKSMSEIRLMVKDCEDREMAVYLYENMIQQAFILSRRFGFKLADKSDVRSTHSPALRENRRKSLVS